MSEYFLNSACYSFLSHTSDVDDLLEGLDGVLKDWLNRLHDSESSLHVVDLWLHAFDCLHLSGNFNEWLSIVESLEDSSGKSFLDVLNGSGLGNGGSLVISSLGGEGLMEGVLKGADELGLAHGVEFSHVFGVNEFVVGVVVMSGGGSSDESKGEFH